MRRYHGGQLVLCATGKCQFLRLTSPRNSAAGDAARRSCGLGA
jgi:hypothetical protein